MINLAIRFPSEAQMFEWIKDMVGCQALPASARVRREDALDKPPNPNQSYVLDGGRDGGIALKLVTHTETTVEVVRKEEA
jgi:hypothetical protein